MKRKLLKSVLVALALVTGSIGVKAEETTTIYERGTSTAPWTDENLSDFTGNAITLSEYGAYYTTSANGDDLSTRTISITENAIVNVDAYWYGMSNTGRYFSDGNGIYFRFGNIFVAQSDQDQKHAYGLNGIANINSASTFKGTNAYRNYDISKKKFLHIEIEINTANNTLNHFRVSEEGNSTYLVNVTDVILENPDYTTIAWGFKRGGRVNTQRHEYLKSIVVKETPQAIKSYDYTIKYVDEEGNAIKDPATRTGLDGESISLLSSDKSSIVYEGVKYVYSSDDCEGKVVSSSETEVTIKFRKAYTATLNINTIINGVTTPSTISLVEADDYTCKWKYTYPLYASKDGVYYKADAISTFGEEGTFTDGETINKTITYTTAENDIVYFSEEPSSQTSGLNYSNGYSGWIPAQNAKNRGLWIGTLEAGNYTLEAYTTTSNTNKRGIGIRAGTNDHIVCIEGTEPGLKSLPFTLLSNTNELFINGKDAVGNVKTIQTEDFDYVLIRKTGDLPSTVSLTVSSAGLATYTPSYNLDFSSASKITAYKAAVSGTAITLTKVTTVAAGEGVLLRGKAGEETTEAIAVATSATTANAGNEFVPVTGEIDQLAETDGDYTNFVLNKVDGVVGFYKANNTHVAAGKAYLKVLTSTLGTETGKSMKLVFGDETTGITEVSNAAKASDKAYYTLSGQRVNAPVKGLYLHNGKKVIIK